MPLARNVPDYYAVLGVLRDADAVTIKSAYRARAKEHHPDLNPGDPEAPTHFMALQDAYDVLRDPQKKARYDEGLPPAREAFARNAQPQEPQQCQDDLAASLESYEHFLAREMAENGDHPDSRNHVMDFLANSEIAPSRKHKLVWNILDAFAEDHKKPAEQQCVSASTKALFIDVICAYARERKFAFADQAGIRDQCARLKNALAENQTPKTAGVRRLIV